MNFCGIFKQGVIFVRVHPSLLRASFYLHVPMLFSLTVYIGLEAFPLELPVASARASPHCLCLFRARLG
jgi:hypothetical protein